MGRKSVTSRETITYGTFIRQWTKARAEQLMQCDGLDVHQARAAVELRWINEDRASLGLPSSLRASDPVPVERRGPMVTSQLSPEQVQAIREQQAKPMEEQWAEAAKNGIYPSLEALEAAKAGIESMDLDANDVEEGQ